MNKLVSALLIALALVSQADADAFLVLPATPDADAAAVADYIRTQARLDATVLPSATVPEDAPTDIGSLARAIVAANPIDPGLRAAAPCVIVLGSFGTEVSQGCFLPDDRLALINLSRLADDDPDGKLLRRAGQEALRIAAMALDIPACPFHLCVLYPCPSAERLDSMSGNYCPPCYVRIHDLAATRNLALPENPED